MSQRNSADICETWRATKIKKFPNKSLFDFAFWELTGKLTALIVPLLTATSVPQGLC
jgi:hypothetical protein